MGIKNLTIPAKVLRLFFVLCLCMAAGPIFAQTEAENQTKFDNARILVDRGQFDLAMKELTSLLQNPTNTFAPDASYLYALAAYKAGKLPEAETRLHNFEQRFPGWPGTSDVNYLRSIIAFSQNKPEAALESLKTIPENELKAEREQLKIYYLKQIRDRNKLAELNRKYPADKEVATAFASIIVTTFTPPDQQLLEQLISTHRLDRAKFQPAPASIKKASYRVGILFPFGLSADLSKKNQFVVDLYEGILYAADSLAKQNIRLDLFTYETTADTNTLKQILLLPELQTMDLIIGPVYKSGSRIMSRFANQYKIPVINPLSEDGELLKGGNFMYLFESSVQTKAREMAEFAYTNFNASNGLILYQNRREDSTMAANYRREYQLLGGTIKIYKKINGTRSATNTATVSNLDTTGIGHMVFFAESQNVAVNALSMVDNKNFKGPVFVPENWLEMQQVQLEQLDARDIYFVAPHQTDPAKPGFATFRKGYQSRTNLPPSVYAKTGFELLWFFGQQLHRNGTGFAQTLPQQGFQPGALYSGFDYSKSSDNGFVPLFKLENLELLRANTASSPINLLPPPPPEPKKDEQKPPKK